jgi:hypothetical protein
MSKMIETWERGSTRTELNKMSGCLFLKRNVATFYEGISFSELRAERPSSVRSWLGRLSTILDLANQNWNKMGRTAAAARRINSRRPAGQGMLGNSAYRPYPSMYRKTLLVALVAVP